MKKILCLVTILLSASVAHAMTGTVDLDRNFAWGSTIGWINFAPVTGANVYEGLVITDTSISGFAWSSQYGWINFSPAQAGVTNTSDGVLGGYAWIAGRGYISMSGATIDSGGEFHGTVGALNTQAGQINFDCAHCDVHTTWRPRSVSSNSGSSSTTSNTNTSSVFSAFSAGRNSDVPSSISTETPVVRPRIPQDLPGVFIAQSAGVQPSDTPKSSLPAELLDVSFSLDRTEVARGSNVTGLISLFNFGQLPTTISLTFSIFDSTGVLVREQHATTTVETERAYRESFNNLDLPTGRYSIRLHTLYAQTIEDNFYASFTVTASHTFFPHPVGLCFFFILLLLWWWLVGKRRHRERD